MKKFIIMSILFAPFWIPLVAATRSQDVRQALKQVQKRFVVFCIVYVVTILYILPRL